MIRTIYFALPLTLALSVITSPALAGGDPNVGKEKSALCAGCHGADGNSANPQFPILAGQYPEYLIRALADYKSGARNNPIMKGMATGLSPSDMRDLAAYFSSQPSALSSPTNW
jgi:cytochrome c553|tara:strand:+ start:599 stop:940 length:342 start_codon:yes stop_codon:yes gene_type:complete